MLCDNLIFYVGLFVLCTYFLLISGDFQKIISLLGVEAFMPIYEPPRLLDIPTPADSKT